MSENGKNNNKAIDDTSELIETVKKDSMIDKLTNTLSHKKLLLIVTGAIILFQFIVLFLLFNQISYYKTSSKMKYLSIYQVEQKIVGESRKKECLNAVMRVALKYYPKWNERRLAELGTLIYEVGEQRYGIPVEEWIVVFTLESEWKRKALSKSGAKGLGQLMPVIAKYIAKALNISWRGNITLFHYLDNPRISMRYYWDLKRQYENPIYYISAYFWGETEMGVLYKNKKQLYGKYKTYFKKFLSIKHDVEKILNKKIFIKGIEEED